MTAERTAPPRRRRGGWRAGAGPGQVVELPLAPLVVLDVGLGPLPQHRPPEVGVLDEQPASPRRTSRRCAGARSIERPESSRPASGSSPAMSSVVGIRSTWDTRASRVPGATPGPAHDVRDAGGLLVGLLLAEQPVLAEQVAVVGDEEDPGPVELAGAPQDVEQSADLVVEVLQLLELALQHAAHQRPVLRREVAQPGGLVGHVGLVEGGRVPGDVVEVVAVLGARPCTGRAGSTAPTRRTTARCPGAAPRTGAAAPRRSRRRPVWPSSWRTSPSTLTCPPLADRGHPPAPAGGDVRRVLAEAVHVLAEVAGVVAGAADPGRDGVAVVPLGDEGRWVSCRGSRGRAGTGW